jgi:hypothetical protein
VHTDLLYKSLSPLDYAALTEAAKQRAVELRREAIRAFWTAAARGLGAAWRSIRRDLSVAPLNPPSSRA